MRAETAWSTFTVTIARRPALRTRKPLTLVFLPADAVTVRAPFIIVACGSHWYRYVPGESVSASDFSDRGPGRKWTLVQVDVGLTTASVERRD